MKQTLRKIEGVVEEVLPNTQFRVRVENNVVMRCYLSGKMDYNKIKVLVGDRVVIEVPNDTKIANYVGRIIIRK